MTLDIRVPIGLLFALFGLLIGGYGLLGAATPAGEVAGVNIDLAWGIVLALFGGSMLWLARWARR